MRWRSVRVIYSVLCGLVAAVGFWSAISLWRSFHMIAASSVYFFLGLSAFYVICAASVLWQWRIARWLAGISGSVMLLYALLVVLMGWEDVGGAAGAIPLSVGTALAGGLGIVVASTSGAANGGAA